MRTTIDIDEELMKKVVKDTGEKSKSRAVNKVLEEYMRRRAIEDIRAMVGKIQIDDLREEQRAADRKRYEFLNKQV
jgi:Arc/MetJ family transcription regulator